MANKKDFYKTLYETIKNNKQKYEAEVHCPMVLETVSTHGQFSSFCVKAKICDSTFWSWTREYPAFDKCFRIARITAQQSWEAEIIDAKQDPEFNFKVWEAQGLMLFGMGKQNKVRINSYKKLNPYDQYQQIMKQASLGEFTSAELKQVMESVNIGLRAYEVIQIQEEVNTMKESINLMEANSGRNIVPIESVKKTN